MDTTKKLELFGLSTKLARAMQEAGYDDPKLTKLLGKVAVKHQPTSEEKEQAARVAPTTHIRRVMPAGAFGRRPRQVKVFGHLFKEDTIARMVCSIFCFLENKGVKEVDHKKVAAAIKEAYPENTYTEVRSMIDQDKWAKLRFSFQQNGEYLPSQYRSAVKGKPKKDAPATDDDVIIEELGV